MTTPDLQEAPKTSSDRSANESRPDRGDDRGQRRDQDNRNQRPGNNRLLQRSLPSADDVIAEVTSAIRNDRGAIGRIRAATGRNAVVMLARSSVGKTLFDVVGDADRAMFIVERKSAVGFDPMKAARRAELEQQYFKIFADLANLTAVIAVEYQVEDVRDSRVKDEMKKIKKAAADLKATPKNNEVA